MDDKIIISFQEYNRLIRSDFSDLKNDINKRLDKTDEEIKEVKLLFYKELEKLSHAVNQNAEVINENKLKVASIGASGGFFSGGLISIIIQIIAEYIKKKS